MYKNKRMPTQKNKKPKQTKKKGKNTNVSCVATVSVSNTFKVYRHVRSCEMMLKMLKKQLLTYCCGSPISGLHQSKWHLDSSWSLGETAIVTCQSQHKRQLRNHTGLAAAEEASCATNTSQPLLWEHAAWVLQNS